MPSALSSPSEILSILARKELIIPSETVDLAYQELADFLTKQYSLRQPVLMPILNGGLMLAAQLMRLCHFPLELEPIKISRYGDGVRGQEISWDFAPELDLQGRHIILLDDILDEGKTLVAVQTALQECHPETVCTLVLVQKLTSSCDQAVKVDRAALPAPDRFLIGEGMDIAGFGRNLRGIWALAEADEKQLLTVDLENSP